jgi:hypothetical protein
MFGGLAIAAVLAALSAGPPGGALAIGVPAPVGNQPRASRSSAAFDIALPFQAFVQSHGGARTFGAPISNDFPLVGKRVQIYEQQVLELRPDGSVSVMSLLDDALPLIHASGLTFPSPDPAITSALPNLGSADYTAQALAAIDTGLLDQTAADDWNGLPVNFATTFHATVSCADLPVDATCDDATLTSAALDMWGLPTAPPASDPADPNLVYLRFQRGIMRYSQIDGQTQAVPVGTWFKRVLLGSDVPADMLADITGSRYYAQFAPDFPLGVARPSDLPATSLTLAFGSAADQSAAARVPYPFPTSPTLASALPTFGTPTATPIDALAVPAAPQATTPGAPNAPSPAATGAANSAQTDTLTPTPTATSSAPQGPDPCAGDEQLLFAPMKPYAGTDVLVAATSSHHHDARSVRLAGPIKTGQPNERQGLLGYVWEWTINPPTEGWYEFNFYVDGARLCATSGFNARPSFGATPTTAPATSLPTATPIPTVTATPTSTVISPPSLSSVSPESGSCNEVLFLQGQNFGYPQSQVSGQVFFIGPGGTRPGAVLGWGATQITVSAPGGATPAGVYNVVVQANGMASNSKTYTVRSTCS